MSMLMRVNECDDSQPVYYICKVL